MASKKEELDGLEHRYSILKKGYEAGDADTQITLAGPLQDLADIILEAIAESWSTRSDEAGKLSEELTSAAAQIRQLKKSIDSILAAAKLATSLLRTLAAVRGVL